LTNHHRKAAKTSTAALIHTRPSKLTVKAALVALVLLVVGATEAAESVAEVELPVVMETRVEVLE
jgi:hypothetical protein